MTETSTTTAPPIATLAMLGVLQHAADRGLAVDGISAPLVPGDPICIRLRPRHFEDWTDNVTLTGPAVVTDVPDTDGTSISHTATVPTAIGDVRVEIWTLGKRVQRPAVPLRLVPGSAS